MIYHECMFCIYVWLDLSGWFPRSLSGPLEEGHWDSREWRERGSSGGGQAGSRARTTSLSILRYGHLHHPMGSRGLGLKPCWQELKGRSSWTTIPVLWPQVLVASSAVSPARADRWHRQLGVGGAGAWVTFGFLGSVWMFPQKIGVFPQNGWFIMENPY